MLEFKIVLEVYAASQQTLDCLHLPIQSNARGGDVFAGGLDNLGVYAASQQTLYIVSGSPSNSMLGGGDLNAMPDYR